MPFQHVNDILGRYPCVWHGDCRCYKRPIRYATGLDLLKTIRGDESTKDIPLLTITAQAQKDKDMHRLVGPKKRRICSEN